MHSRHRRSWRAGRVRGPLPAILVAFAMATVLGACDILDRALSVEAAGFADATELAKPENAHLLVSGTIADFECALGAYIINGALLGNELRDASVTASRFSLDQRILERGSPYGVNACNGNPPGIYRPLATAVWSSNNALERLSGWTDAEVADRTDLIAQAAAYSGYAHTLMGEGFCSSVIEVEGQEVLPPAIFAAAETRFGQAIQSAGTNTDILNMAQLGRARVRLNLGNVTGAVSDAQAVLDRNPTYVKVASASTAHSRRWNRVGDEFLGGRITVDPSYRDLTVEGEEDVRVRIIDTGTVGHDNATPVFLAAKIGTTRATPLRTLSLPVATWREAHLIIAEADPAQTVARINVLRDFWELPQYAGGTAAENAAQVIEERARELFLEGHHLNDLRRFDLPNTPDAGTPYRQGGQYGSVRCFDLPNVERFHNKNVN